jgi:hypothetical protein
VKSEIPGVENRKQVLLAGVKIVDTVLVPHGFAFVLEKEGESSGGYFASGAYYRGNRKLELHFRWSLGLVTYHIEEAVLDHETYMRLLNVYGQNRYPDFPQNPKDSFKHLALDLQNFCSDFLSGEGEQFKRLAADLHKNSQMFKGLP